MESISDLAEQELSYSEFDQFYPMADELVSHLEDQLSYLTYEQR